MVAKITAPSSLKRALNYNEQKVKEDRASCLLASGFLKEAGELNFNEKLARLESLIQLNGRATTNTVHISLNFAEGEKLPEETLKEIASLYMEKIGFAAQPFLVYEHRDAGHPHLHIVSTNIQKDGRRISLHNLGKGPSEKARKELEVQFGLVKAGEKKKNVEPLQAQSSSAQKVVYGKLPIKRAITNVLDAVLPHYKYASLLELNAILRPYNVLADRGAEDSIIYRTGGLVYRILDEEGNKVGVPVKASALYNKPTLSFLAQKFGENAVQKEPYKKQLQSAINWILIRPPTSLAALEKELQKENISLVTRQNEEGFVYGLTYIDHRTRCVFNGSELGKLYSAKGVMEKCGITQLPKETESLAKKSPFMQSSSIKPRAESKWNKQAALRILDKLLAPVQVENIVPFELRKQKRKRKKM
jgi:hypothetical protein